MSEQCPRCRTEGVAGHTIGGLGCTITQLERLEYSHRQLQEKHRLTNLALATCLRERDDAQAEAERLRKGIMDAVAAMGSPDDGKERLREALIEVRAKAQFELDHPTGLHATCLSLIAKAADKALAAREKGADECTKPA